MKLKTFVLALGTFAASNVWAQAEKVAHLGSQATVEEGFIAVLKKGYDKAEGVLGEPRQLAILQKQTGTTKPVRFKVSTIKTYPNKPNGAVCKRMEVDYYLANGMGRDGKVIDFPKPFRVGFQLNLCSDGTAPEDNEESVNGNS
ncbi:hypothetical protein D6779_02150 [Candidatus Parcubacteria bacterium]|nr:MAG: hypothetical protein D6779_02150 [Candidatus Parcubacteria bacterium]